MTPRYGLPLILMGLLAASSVDAATTTLVSSRDNTLYENALGLASNGSGYYFFAGRTANLEQRRGLVRFSVGDSIAPGSTITSVSVTLYMSKFPDLGGVPAPVVLHRVLKDWGEGASNADFEEGGGTQPEPGDATWLHTFYDTLNTNLWTNPGGDFFSPFSASATIDTVIGFYTWNSTSALVSDVQGWVNNPSTNFGWLLRVSIPGAKTAKRFNTREDTTAARWPRVTITYTPPVTGVAGGSGSEQGIRLGANAPNPFGARTTLAFDLARAGDARLTIHDAQGRRLATLVDGLRPAGPGVAIWDGRDDAGAAVASGVYFSRLESAGETRVRKIHLMR